MRSKALLLIYIGCLSLSAQARVFDFKNAGLAAYIRGTGGLTNLDKDSFDKASGAGTKVSGSSAYAYGGEIGAMLGFGEHFHMRLGLEVMQPSGLSKAKGTSASGVERFSLDSSVFVFNPNVTFEYIYQVEGSWRFFGALGVGYADVTVENKYNMSASSDLSTASYSEKLGGKGMSGLAAMGVETLFLDNVTFAMDLGYRYMPVSSLTYKADVVGFNGTFAKGDSAVDSAGKKRAVDLSGVIIGASFRFYFNFL